MKRRGEPRELRAELGEKRRVGSAVAAEREREAVRQQAIAIANALERGGVVAAAPHVVLGETSKKATSNAGPSSTSSRNSQRSPSPTPHGDSERVA